MARTQTRSPYGGKLVDTWYYEYQGIDPEHEGESPRVAPLKVPVELRLHKKFADTTTPPLPAKEVWFEVVCPSGDFKLTGSDIEALRAAMWGKLDEAFAVKWERYFLVQIGRERVYSGQGTALSFSYDDIEKGTAFDGSLLMRRYQMSKGLVIEPWPDEFRNNRGRVISCIPATEENRVALEAFAKKIDELREMLTKFLEPEHIMQTLANGLSSMLPAIEPPEHDEDMEP
jgi:hypothetical protein